MRAASDILVIDDEPGIVEFVTDLLTEEGYAVRTATDGAQALHEVTVRLPALLLMDWHMPGRSGRELLRQLRSQGLHDLPIIVMSADATSGTVLNAGATAFLAKPFVLDELLTCINQCLLPGVSPGRCHSSAFLVRPEPCFKVA